MSVKEKMQKAADWVLNQIGLKKKTKKEIIINVENLETRVALMENGRLEEYTVDIPEEERLVGCIFKGRIENLEDDLQAAFVNIGLKKNAFLHYWDMSPDSDAFLDEEDDTRSDNKKKKRKPNAKRFTNEEIHQKFPVGSEICVMITKDPISTKGPRVSANLAIPGRYLVMMPGESVRGISRKISDKAERDRLRKILDRLTLPPDVGVIARTAGIGVKPKAFARDLRQLLQQWEELKANQKTRMAPCCIHKEPGLVERVVRDWLTDDIECVMIDDKDSYEEMLELTKKISRRAQKKLRRYEGPANIFDHTGVSRQLESAFRRQVPLKSGGYLVIDETEALVAVDVNTGHHKLKDKAEAVNEGKNLQEQAILAVNLEAVEEVARQLRIRNIGGLVVLDLIDMKSSKHQRQVQKALKEALKRDRARTNVQDISKLGLLEMSRQREEKSIISKLSSTCPCCNGHGVISSPLAISIEIQRKLVELLRRAEIEKRPFMPKILVAPAVLQRLSTEDETILKTIQKAYATQLRFRAEPHRHPESFQILDSESGQVLYSTGGNLPSV